VAALFDSGKAFEHIREVCRLLGSKDEGLREKVKTRIRRAGEDRAKAEPLMQALRACLLDDAGPEGKPAGLLVSAVQALREIPHRRALAIIVEAWREHDDAEVSAACRSALELVIVGATTPEQAERYLAEHGHATYFDLFLAAQRARREQIERLRGYQKELLEQAGAGKAFEIFARADDVGRELASARLRELAAKKGGFGKLSAPEFASGVYDAFRRERERRARSPATLANLVQTLTLLAGGEDPPLWEAEKPEAVVAAVAPLVQSPEGWAEVGKACVALLAAAGEEGAVALGSFAREFQSSADVRRDAVQALGDLARSNERMADFVGLTLADLLRTEKAEAVRRKILFDLRSAPREQATAPIREFFFPADPENAVRLSSEEIKYCIEILGRIGSESALQVLMELAAKHARDEVRLLAVREGLLGRNGGADEEARILDHLGAIVRDGRQSASVRTGVIEALGERGGWRAFTVLVQLGRTEGLAAALRTAIAAAKLRLAERLVTPPNGAAVGPEALETATRALRELHATADPKRLDTVARKLVAVSDEREIPAGEVRHLRARIYARLPDAKPAERLALYREAVDKAEADGLKPGGEIALLEEYRGLLAAGRPDEERHRAFVAASERLAALAAGDVPKSVGYLLDAADCALTNLEDRELAGRMLIEAQKRGPVEGPVAARLAELRKRLGAPPPKTPEEPADGG
jgi:hypothetical protein